MALVTKEIIYSIGNNHGSHPAPDTEALVYGTIKGKWSMNRPRQDYRIHGITITDRMGDSIHIGDQDALKQLHKALGDIVDANDRVNSGWTPAGSTVVD